MGAPSYYRGFRLTMAAEIEALIFHEEWMPRDKAYISALKWFRVRLDLVSQETGAWRVRNGARSIQSDR
jgi:hypothetical protein